MSVRVLNVKTIRRRSDAGLQLVEESATNKTLGMILIALGLFGLAWGGFTYTTREKVVDIGPIHATRDKTHNVAVPARWRSLAASCCW